MVNVASAGKVDIQISSLNGSPITPVKEITILPTDYIDMDITFDAPNTEYLFSIGIVFNVVGPGTLDLASTVRHADYDSTLERKGTNPPWIVEAGSWLGPEGTHPAIVLAVRNILLHCDARGLVTITLSDYSKNPTDVTDGEWNSVPFQYGSGVIIHQIPEPMTLTLLGLGSLFLARRKK
jgi:hypothetical protein